MKKKQKANQKMRKSCFVAFGYTDFQAYIIWNGLLILVIQG